MLIDLLFLIWQSGQMSAWAASREARGLCPTSWGLTLSGRIKTKYLRTWVKPLMSWSGLPDSDEAVMQDELWWDHTNKKTHKHACRRARWVSLFLYKCLHSTGWCPHRLLSGVTLGSGLHAFLLSSAQIKNILCIMGALRWGNSVKHITWWRGTFYDEECLYSHTHKHTHKKKLFSNSVLAPSTLCLVPNGPVVPNQKACMFLILSEGDCKRTVCLVLCVWSHYVLKFWLRYPRVLCALCWWKTLRVCKWESSHRDAGNADGRSSHPCQTSLPPHLKLHRWSVTHQVV